MGFSSKAAKLSVKVLVGWSFFESSLRCVEAGGRADDNLRQLWVRCGRWRECRWVDPETRAGERTAPTAHYLYSHGFKVSKVAFLLQHTWKSSAHWWWFKYPRGWERKRRLTVSLAPPQGWGLKRTRENKELLKFQTKWKVIISWKQLLKVQLYLRQTVHQQMDSKWDDRHSL